MKYTKYLTTFFKEKDLSYKMYEIEVNGETHFIDSETVIELVLDAPNHEQEQIATIIRKIDFMNGDVHHFLEHLAKSFILTQYARA